MGRWYLAWLLLLPTLAFAQPVPDLTTEGIPRTNVRVGSSAATRSAAQIITTTTPTVAAVCLAMTRYGTPTAPLTVTVARESAPGVPVASVTTAPALLSTSYRQPSWPCVSFDPVLADPAGTRYRVTVATSATSATNFYQVLVDSADPYKAGAMVVPNRVRSDVLLRAYAQSAPPPPPPPPQLPPPPPPPLTSGFEGFGAVTTGGTGQPIYEVTTLADSGPGSIRDAIAQSNREIVFRVSGVITTSDYLWVRGHHLTIDGTTAPDPGVTIQGRGLLIRGSRGAHDIILRGLRFRECAIDCVTVDVGAHSVIVDHCSMHGAADGNLDTGYGGGVHSVTYSWNLIHGARGDGKNSLTAYNPQFLSYHHNLYSGVQRNPQVRYDDGGALSPGTTVDFVNNLVRPSASGTFMRWGVRANIVNNYFIPRATAPLKSLMVEGTSEVYVDGNASSLTSYDPNDPANYVLVGEVTSVSLPFAAAPVTTTDALTAACQILEHAGPRPLDPVDQALVDSISIDGCP